MKRTAIILALIAPILLVNLPSANAANVTQVHACNTYHSFNGNAKVKTCVYAYQDNTNDRIWVSFTAVHVSGFQNPNSMSVLLRDWTSHDGSDPWCDGLGGRDGPCTGGGDNSVFAGIPIALGTAKLAPFDHFCVQHGEAVMQIYWPGGGQSTPILNSPNTNTIGAGCWL
jgi:hypothetical protein